MRKFDYAHKLTDISIHALLAESDRFFKRSAACISISIHALLAESDPAHRPSSTRPRLFLSTLSLRRATQDNLGITGTTAISIHALLAESDRPFRDLRARD